MHDIWTLQLAAASRERAGPSLRDPAAGCLPGAAGNSQLDNQMLQATAESLIGMH